MAGGPFAGTRYVLRRRMLKLLAPAFRVHGADGAVVLYARMAAFRLRDDIRVFASEAMDREVLRIRARGMIDAIATFDVVDSASGTRLGSLRRLPFASLVRDAWAILDPAGVEVGRIVDPRAALSLLRDVPYVGGVLKLVPQRFEGTVGGAPVLTFRQLFNPLVHRVALDFSADSAGLLDRRLGLAAGVVLCVVEGHGGG